MRFSVDISIDTAKIFLRVLRTGIIRTQNAEMRIMPVNWGFGFRHSTGSDDFWNIEMSMVE